MSPHILVADDHPGSRSALAAVLAAPGWNVELVESGRAALERLLQDAWDLSLLDMYMPELTGLEVLSQVRQCGRRVPSILMSGNPSRRLEAAALEAGAAALLRKPIPAEVLRLTVQAVLQRNGGRPPGPPGARTG